jgi:hypothetical protein
MKRFTQTAFLLLLLLISSLPAQGLSARDTVLQLLKDYSPSGYFLVNEYQNFQITGSKIDIMAFVHQEDETGILSAIPTVVHEFCHLYTSHKAAEVFRGSPVKSKLNAYDYDTYYLPGQPDFLVKRGKVFITREMAAGIPESLRTFRFKSYVDTDNSHLSSQCFGVYGLLNEFHAYYHDTKTAVDLYPYYRDQIAPGVKRWDGFFTSVDSTFFAYGEFKFFILKYLQYAKANYPEIYQGIIDNKAFVEAFLTIDQEFAQLISDYFQLKEAIFESLRKEDYTVTEDDQFWYIGNSNMKIGHSNHRAPYNLLTTELAKEEYQMIVNDLRGSL